MPRIRVFPPLRNPVNDAKAPAAALEHMGFQVDLLLNAKRAAMLKAIAALRVAGNLVRNYTLNYMCVVFKGIECNAGCYSRQHRAGRLPTNRAAKPASFLQSGANR